MLSDKIDVPLISKDGIKETLYETIATSHSIFACTR